MAPPRQSNVRRRETSTGDFHELGVKGRCVAHSFPRAGVDRKLELAYGLVRLTSLQQDWH